MIDGNFVEFLDHLNYGDELWIKYKGVIYFIQGWTEKSDDTKRHCVLECHSFATDPVTKLFHAEADSMAECAKKLLAAPVFDGKKLTEIEQDVQWVDDEMG